jgi:hypothetical protein
MPVLDILGTLDDIWEDPAWLMFGLAGFVGLAGLALLFLLYPFARD